MMNRYLGWLAAVVLFGAGPAGSAQAYIIAQDVEQPLPDDQPSFEVELDGGGRIIRTNELIGGTTSATSPYADPWREDGDNRVGGINTVVRYRSRDDSGIASSPGTPRHFALAGWGAAPPIKGRSWGTIRSFVGSVPAPSARFERTSGGSVTVTIFNATDPAFTFSVSAVGYQILPRDSFSIGDVNASSMPADAFTSGGVPDATELASGAEATFTVSGVGFDDDVVIYLESSFSGASAGQGVTAATANWFAMDSGAPPLLRGPWFGRINTIGLHDSFASVDTLPDLGVVDMVSKTPFKVVTAVVGPPARFVPFQVDGDPLTELLINTAGPGGMKLSYLRTNGGDVYNDVTIEARFEPGGSTGTTTAVPSDDFGGPVAVRIQPGGGAYYLSVVTGRANSIDIMVDSPDGSSQTPIATATQWDNGDPIALDFDLTAPTPFVVTLTAQGLTISATVREQGNPAHTVDLSAQDTTYSRGYIGLRSQRDGSPIQLEPDRTDTSRFDIASGEAETLIDLFSIRDPNFVPTLGRAIFLTDSETRTDNPDHGFSGNDERTGENLADHALAAFLQNLGFEVAEVDSDNEWRNPPFTVAEVNANFDLMWISGGSGSGASRRQAPCLTIPFIFSEHVVARDQWAGVTTSTGPDLRRGALGRGREFFRIPPAGDGGSPDHVILAGFPVDGTGDQEGTNLLQFYDEPQSHMQNIHPSVGADLAFHVVPEGDDGSLTTERRDDGSIHTAVSVVDAGQTRAGPPDSGIVDCNRNPVFDARTAFFGVGDAQFHRLSAEGRELARRTVLWLVGREDLISGGPELVQVMDGMGPSPDTFISPLGEDVPFNTAQIELTADAELAAGAGMTLTSNGGGNHTLTLDTPVPVGTCVTLTIDVRDLATGGVGTISITLCHLPLDVNQDGQVNIQDITAWGAEFNGAGRAALVDTNGNGSVNVQDATSVGDNWFGRLPATKPWNGEALPL